MCVFDQRQRAQAESTYTSSSLVFFCAFPVGVGVKKDGVYLWLCRAVPDDVRVSMSAFAASTYHQCWKSKFKSQ